MQLYTAARLELCGGRSVFCPQPRLSDNGPLALARTAVESDRLSSQPAAYMQAIIDYCYEGNLEVEFRGQDNATRKWYHAPWLIDLRPRVYPWSDWRTRVTTARTRSDADEQVPQFCRRPI